jgi:hypothetical protein
LSPPAYGPPSFVTPFGIDRRRPVTPFDIGPQSSRILAWWFPPYAL